MTTPCKQDTAVATLTEAVRSLVESAKRSEHLQEKTLATLEVLAAQGEQIKSLTARQDSLESRLTKHTEEMFPRMRTLEDAKIKTDVFITNHDRDDERGHELSVYIRGGLVVAALTAVAGFLLYLYAHTGQVTAVQPAPVEVTGRK